MPHVPRSQFTENPSTSASAIVNFAGAKPLGEMSSPPPKTPGKTPIEIDVAPQVITAQIGLRAHSC